MFYMIYPSAVPVAEIDEYYEGKSLNKRNFIITFYKSTYRNCLCLIFGHRPPASQSMWSTCPQACGYPLERSFLVWPLTNFAPPHYLVICKLLAPQMFFHRSKKSESLMAPSLDCMVDVSSLQISEHVVYPLYARSYGCGLFCDATIPFLREVPGVSIISWASTPLLACHCMEH